MCMYLVVCSFIFKIVLDLYYWNPRLSKKETVNSNGIQCFLPDSEQMVSPYCCYDFPDIMEYILKL